MYLYKYNYISVYLNEKNSFFRFWAHGRVSPQLSTAQ